MIPSEVRLYGATMYIDFGVVFEFQAIPLSNDCPRRALIFLCR